MAQPCDIDLWVMKSRYARPIFHGPVTLPLMYEHHSNIMIILNTIS